MAQITYTDKVDISTSPVAAINKVVADDMNEIKTVVNTNDTLRGDLTTLNTTAKTSVVSAINEVNNNSIYSSSEIAVGTWIDNKTIYRRTYEISVAANTTDNSTDLSSLGYDKVWVNNGESFNYYGGNTNTTSGVNWYNGSSDYGLVYVNPSKILNVKNMSGSTRYYYIVLEYTKTS